MLHSQHFDFSQKTLGTEIARKSQLWCLGGEDLTDLRYLDGFDILRVILGLLFSDMGSTYALNSLQTH